MYKNLKRLRESLNMTQKEFAASLSIGNTTYNGYETGARDPKSDFWIDVATKYNVTIDYLMGFSDDPHKTTEYKNAPSISDEALRLARDFNDLDEHGKRVTRVVINEEKQRMRAEIEEQEPQKPATKIIPLFGNSFAAGAGEPDFGNVWENYEVEASSPADFAIKINGDSMEPYLPDGSIAFGQKGTPHDGDVAALLLDGEFLCKQVCQDYIGNVHLFSLNRKRSDLDRTIPPDSERSLACFGTIIMKKRVPLPVD